jgi:hypothetical protein
LRLTAYLLDPVKPEEMMPVAVTISPTEGDVNGAVPESVTMPDGSTVLIIEDHEHLWEALCRCKTLCSFKTVKRKLIVLKGKFKMKITWG